MKNLILLYCGCVFLMYLSQVYYAGNNQRHILTRSSFLWQNNDVFILLMIVWMTCFSFLRTSYNDTGNYIMSFRDAVSVKEGFADGTFFDLTGNPLSMLHQSIIHDRTDNYHFFFLLPALLSYFAAVKLFRHYSVNPAFSVLIFFSIGTYVMYIAALKQSLAIFFLLMALPYAIDRKYVRFYLLVMVAILFHTHAFMFAIIPFLMEKPWGKITWLGVAVMAFLMATYDVTMRAFMEFGQSIGAMVVENEVFDGHQINVIRILVCWVPAVLALCFRRRLFYNSSRTENLFVNMSVVSAVIMSIGLVEGANLFGRMAGYFEIATAIALPWMIQKLFNLQSVKLVTIMASVLYFGFFLFEFGVSKDFSNDYAAITLWDFIVSLF